LLDGGDAEPVTEQNHGEPDRCEFHTSMISSL
jgi:hypothetical protein